MISCSTYRTFEVEVLQPAEKTLTEGKNIGFWYRNVRFASDTTFFLYYQDGLAPEELAAIFYYGLNDMVNQEGERDTVAVVPPGHVVYQDSLPQPLTPGEIKSLCDRMNVDFIVALEMYVYGVNIPKHIVNSNYFIRLYSRNSVFPVDTILYKDNLADILSDEYDYVSLMRDNAYQKGGECAKNLVPYWRTEMRRVYNGEKILRMGDLFLQNNDPGQAKELWEAATRLSPKIALRAYINLAWIYENEGDFSMAQRLLENAVKLAKDNKLDNQVAEYGKQYLKVIEKRIAYSRQLEQQLY